MGGDNEYYGARWAYRDGSSVAEAVAELVECIETTTPSNFTPTITERCACRALSDAPSLESLTHSLTHSLTRSLTRSLTHSRACRSANYVRAEYESPTFGFIDDGA